MGIWGCGVRFSVKEIPFLTSVYSLTLRNRRLFTTYDTPFGFVSVLFPSSLFSIGPSRSHKTAIVSFLTGMIDHLNYNPGSTIGVRILETEHQNIRIETWDVSGDQSYENTWTAIQKDTDGILLIYNADTMGHSVSILRISSDGEKFTVPKKMAVVSRKIYRT